MRKFWLMTAAVLSAISQTSGIAFAKDPPPRPVAPNIVYPRPHPHPYPPYPKPQPDTNTGLCRRAPALAQMANENRGQQNQNPTRWSPRVGAPALEKDVPVPMDRDPAPPPAPPPPPPPAPVVMPDVFTSPAPVTTIPSASDSVASGAARGEAALSAARPATRSTARATSEKSAASPRGVDLIPPRFPSPPRNQQVQSGQLTAGEHDDLLNPANYARYVSTFLAGETLSGVPRVDTGKALIVVVTDSTGAPMLFATVTLTCTDNNTLSLTTMADGRVAFFPDLDRLGSSVRMTATADNGASSPIRTLNVADVRGAQTVRTQLSSRAPNVRKFDLAVVIDATGSMGDEINFLKAELAEIIQTLSRRHRGLDIRVAMVIYRDQGDEFVTRTFEFTSDMGAVQTNLSAQSAGGGGDMPEAMEEAMARAVGLNWRNDAVKSMLLVADAPPHSGDIAATWAATEVARAKRIQIVPIAASGVDGAAQYIMRAMAAATQSRYAFLTDDSGIGNAHAEPSVDCYHVTKLDSLVRRILDAQISGRRIEPATNEIVRTVGDYDNGRCRGA